MNQSEKKPTAYILIGLPCCGKTTWAQKQPDNLEIASTDAFIDDYALVHNVSFSEAFEQSYEKAKSLMETQIERLRKKGQSFIWDQNNIRKEERSGIYELLKETYEVIFVYFKVPQEECILRYRDMRQKQNLAVEDDYIDNIKQIADMAVFPDENERCDKLMTVIPPSPEQDNQKEQVIITVPRKK